MKARSDLIHGRTPAAVARRSDVVPADLTPSIGPESGDRFEVTSTVSESGQTVVQLPPHLTALCELESLTDERGRELRWRKAAGSAVEILDAVPGVQWIEWEGAGAFRVLGEAAAKPLGLGDVALDDAFSRVLKPNQINREAKWSDLAAIASQLSTHQGFDQLIALNLVRDFEPLEHQVKTARTVLQRMRGRALLCDEVGMGKTIEAGLILLELLKRGLARSVLVITPPSLVEQWRGEMLRKFGIDLTAQAEDATARLSSPKSGAARTDWCRADRVIASIHTAKREPYRSILLERKWDVVVIDEAHHLRNRKTQMWDFASQIRKQSILLLTATPVQNNLNELFNLVTLLEPGLLSTQKDFGKRFMDKSDVMTPRNVDELHDLLAEVMVRNRRSTSGLHFTHRLAVTESVAMTDGEQAMHDQLANLVRGLLTRHKQEDSGDDDDDGDNRERAQPASTGLTRMALLTLQMAMGSSAAAATQVILNLLSRHRLPPALRAQLEAVRDLGVRQDRHAKLDRLVQVIEAFGDKMVIFTQFRATQELIGKRLAEAGYDTILFHGGLSRMEKEAAVQAFQSRARVMVCTESGSEGRNLQFAHGLCNYDLPWNPMKIEQRIGRLSRIGQKHDVHVFNFVARGTIEQSVLNLLDAKLNMFELVIGEVDMILGNLGDEKDFPEVIADLWAGSSGDDEFAARMEVLGARLLAAKVEYLRQKSADEKLFGNRFAPDA
jgi:SNF2 family DNA or RNA helicase